MEVVCGIRKPYTVATVRSFDGTRIGILRFSSILSFVIIHLLSKVFFTASLKKRMVLAVDC